MKKKPLFGPFIKCPHPEMIEACGIAGFDIAVVDMEHTPLGPRDLYPLVLAAERRNLKLIVRIPAKNEEYFKWCLDLGIEYIQVPHVQTAEDVQIAINHSYYGPIGERGLCRFVRASDFSGIEKNEYLKSANQRTKLILQVEGTRGLQNIDEILKAGRFDTLFIGPYDLSQSLGKPGQIWDPVVVDAMKKIISSCRAQGVKVGTFTDTADGIKFWKETGVDLIQYGSDLNLFLDAAQKLLSGESQK